MKVILCEDVDSLGDMGETVTVARGYARNYLLPRRLAVVADSASAKQIEHEMRIIRKREEKRRGELQEVAKGVMGVKIEFTAKAGAEGKLFGSITSLHIAEQLQALGHPVNRRKIQLSEPIRSLGDHEVPVRLTSGIEATIIVTVTAEAPKEGEAVKVAEEPPAEASAEATETEESTDEAAEVEAQADEKAPAEENSEESE